jgi:cell shape-determining protein MreC
MSNEIDMVEYCNALKETARQKESDNTEALTKQQLLNRIRKLEAENFILRRKLEEK